MKQLDTETMGTMMNLFVTYHEFVELVDKVEVLRQAMMNVPDDREEGKEL